MSEENEKYHQFHRAADGSVCVRKLPGDKWFLLQGHHKTSDAAKLADAQNKFWSARTKEAIDAHKPENRVKFIRRD